MPCIGELHQWRRSSTWGTWVFHDAFLRALLRLFAASPTATASIALSRRSWEWGIVGGEEGRKWGLDRWARRPGGARRLMK